MDMRKVSLDITREKRRAVRLSADVSVGLPFALHCIRYTYVGRAWGIEHTTCATYVGCLHQPDVYQTVSAFRATLSTSASSSNVCAPHMRTALYWPAIVIHADTVHLLQVLCATVLSNHFNHAPCTQAWAVCASSSVLSPALAYCLTMYMILCSIQCIRCKNALFWSAEASPPKVALCKGLLLCTECAFRSQSVSRCHNSSRLHETRNQSTWITELTAAVWVLEFYMSLAAGTPLSVRVEVEVRIHISMRPGNLNIQERSAGQT